MKCRTDAFTLAELLAVVAVLGLLAGLLWPLIARAQELKRRTLCLSHLRQLNEALGLYTDDHDSLLPSRQPNRRWPAQLQPYYLSTKLLVCPSDDQRTERPAGPPDAAPRSYSLSGFGDPQVDSFEEESWPQFVDGPAGGTLRQESIQHPSETVVLGETHGSDFYVELKREAGSFIEVLVLGRHGLDREDVLGDRSGGANHAFADGSVRFVDFGKAICPVNLWGITDYYRTNYALCFF